MNSINKPLIRFMMSIATLASLTLTFACMASTSQKLVDDFTHSHTNSIGIERLFMSDKMAGGDTWSSHHVKDSVLYIKGEIAPPRGQPGWASSVIPLAPMGKALDASEFSGIKIRLMLTKGTLSISANSSEISNFDYHTSPIKVASDGQFHEVKIPFSQMKRLWSPQTTLNTQTLNSISIVAFGAQQGPFDFALDEVSFY